MKDRVTAQEFQQFSGQPSIRKARRGEGGTRFPKLPSPNKTEAEWLRLMQERHASARYEPFTLNLPDGTKYTPDVVVFATPITCYEVKGTYEHNDRWKLKIKAARAAFPELRFAIAKKERTNGWLIIE